MAAKNDRGGDFCQKFNQNRSILHRFREKYVFEFYAEIQDGRQNDGKSRQ